MDISKNSVIYNVSAVQPQSDEPKNTNPNFRGLGSTILNGSGKLMQKIENGGFLVLFLIQDFCGMTMPRSAAGFLRDREVTGEYNFQEGFEVLGREMLTGPIMMAVAPLSLYFASKWANSTGINSELIKYYGNNLKEMVSKPDFDNSLLKDAAKFKETFYRKNVENILNETLGKENVTKESVDYVLNQLKNIENIPKDVKLEKFRGKSKYKSSCFNNIVEHINNIKYKTGSDLELLRKVKLGSETITNPKVFDAKNAFEGLIKYSNDAISANKKLDKLNEAVAEKLKHNALGKRLLVNIGMVAATLGVLSVLPKIYAKNDKAPGARKNQEQKILKEENKNINFKGKSSFLEKIGKQVDKNKNSFVSSELEYNGHNFTSTLMAGLSIFGLLLPRGLRAYSRADVDEKGRKDLTELWEILIRDISSSLAVVFAVPMLTKACVTSYEKKSGFVLMQKNRNMSKFKEILDLINPYSKSHVLSNAELSALYDGVNSKEKMINFCKYIDKNGGDLKKILSKSEALKEVFNENTFKLDTLSNLKKSESNGKIIKFIQNIETELGKTGKSIDKPSVDKLISKLMKGAAKAGGRSKITTFARGLNSVPGLLTTFFISPYILGWFIPRLTYKNTRRIHEKQDRERQAEANKLKTQV